MRIKTDVSFKKRDKIFLTENTGLGAVGLESKMYIKSVFGASSPQYKAIKGLNFIRPKST